MMQNWGSHQEELTEIDIVWDKLLPDIGVPVDLKKGL